MSKDELIRHLSRAHGGTYMTARTTKRELGQHHDWLHSGSDDLNDEAKAQAATHQHVTSGGAA